MCCYKKIMIQIIFPDGNVRSYEVGTSALDIAKSISSQLAAKILVARVNGAVVDATRPINTDATLQLITWDDTDGKKTFWHSSAHLLAEAIEEMYPGTKFGIGPAIEEGFYYDIDLGDKVLSSNDFTKIEEKVLELARKKSEYKRTEVSKADALAYFTEKKDEYKLELINDLKDGEITFYQQGNFTDLCRGPHIPNTEIIKAIKLTKVAGAYWRGDEKRKQLTRVYAVTYPKQQDLKDYLFRMEEAKKRDHRKLGAELELFMFSERVGAGLPIWLPRGAALRSRLEDFLKKEQIKRGYLPVVTPNIGKKELYVTSGHWEKYGEDAFQPIKTPRIDEEFLLKPMNCPHHCEIFAHKPRSYKELPVRIAEFGTVYRYEQAGELHGLTRVRGFTQDDAHLFCTEDQIKKEFLDVLDLTMMVIKKLGFDNFTAQISLRDPENPTKYIGSIETWDKAENAIREAAHESGLKTTEVLGEAAFYGPKLDFMVRDAIGRSWQLGTIQIDYNLPERFKLEYVGADNQMHRPVMIHRAPFGSLERFIGVLTEHCAGKFPLWLAPDQYAILPLSERFQEYALKVKQTLEAKDIRGYIDERAETIGRKIRDTELKRIPIMLIIGEKEEAEGKISVRKQGEGDLGAMTMEEFTTYFETLL